MLGTKTMKRERIDPFMDEIRCIQMNYWLVWMDAHSL